MNVLFLMIPITLVIASGFVFSFLWASKADQFDDLETPALRILKDDGKD